LVNVDQFSYFFSLLNSQMNCKKSWNYNCHLPQIYTALQQRQFKSKWCKDV